MWSRETAPVWCDSFVASSGKQFASTWLPSSRSSCLSRRPGEGKSEQKKEHPIEDAGFSKASSTLNLHPTNQNPYMATPSGKESLEELSVSHSKRGSEISGSSNKTEGEMITEWKAAVSASSVESCFTRDPLAKIPLRSLTPAYESSAPTGATMP